MHKTFYSHKTGNLKIVLFDFLLPYELNFGGKIVKYDIPQ